MYSKALIYTRTVQKAHLNTSPHINSFKLYMYIYNTTPLRDQSCRRMARAHPFTLCSHRRYQTPAPPQSSKKSSSLSLKTKRKWKKERKRATPWRVPPRRLFPLFTLSLSLSPGFYDSSFFILCAPASLPPELCTCLLLLLLLLKSVAAARFFSSSMPALSFFFSPLLHNHEGWCAQQSFEWGDTERATVMRRASVMLSSYVHGCGALK